MINGLNFATFGNGNISKLVFCAFLCELTSQTDPTGSTMKEG